MARPLGISMEYAAEGVIRIINANMTGALKVVSVERGYDPKDFTLVAFGGAGPLHGVELGRALGCRAVLVPRYPGLLCALGLLATDLQYDYARTALQRGPDYDSPLSTRLRRATRTGSRQRTCARAFRGAPPLRAAPICDTRSKVSSLRWMFRARSRAAPRLVEAFTPARAALHSPNATPRWRS